MIKRYSNHPLAYNVVNKSVVLKDKKKIKQSRGNYAKII